MIGEVIARLKSGVPDLQDRVGGAGAFAAIMERNAWPERTPSAYVIPAGLRGGAVSISDNAYLQDTAETISIVLILRPNDRLGARGIEPVEALRDDVIASLAGWSSGAELGTFQLTSARMLNVRAGALAYQVDFTISDQLRILA